jgi:hypothetical protein
MRLSLKFLGILSLGGLIAGCGPSASRDRPNHSHDHETPHGGQLVALGDESYHLEFVFHPDEGMVHLYVMDGDLERYVRIDATELALAVKLPAGAETLTLNATGNAVTGEEVGNTSLFEGSADSLGKMGAFEASMERIAIEGHVYEGVTVQIRPAEGDPAHDHTHDH